MDKFDFQVQVEDGMDFATYERELEAMHEIYGNELERSKLRALDELATDPDAFGPLYPWLIAA